MDRLWQCIRSLYGDDPGAEEVCERVERRLSEWRLRAMTNTKATDTKERWNETDVVLITYADSIRNSGRGDVEEPLKCLKLFLKEFAGDAFQVVHVLPFSPSSSDCGFSVIDYRAVDPQFGGWVEMDELGKDVDLMFDLVLNHCSAQSAWFKSFLAGSNDPAAQYFFTVTDEQAASPELFASVVRPRSLPLLTSFQARDRQSAQSAPKWVWTTFSRDQVDLDWRNPDVLLEFLDILLLYLEHGARIIRLDAVAFVWKQLGTRCIHLAQTHEIVKIFRAVMDLIAPRALLLTETNVPHEENVSYFGGDIGVDDEAHMVYNFSLPPLLLHALLKGDATALTKWAADLEAPEGGRCFFNFTASHDGIGLRPLQGLLPDTEVQWLVQQVRARGGRVSMRAAPGADSPYELNITYLDALRVEGEDVNSEVGIARFLCSQAVALSFRGMPAIYVHSLLGTRNDIAGVLAPGGENRSINRHKWDFADLRDALSPASVGHEARVLRGVKKLIGARRSRAAFHPDAEQRVLDLGPCVFALVRTPAGGAERAASCSCVCLYNFTSRRLALQRKGLEPHITPGVRVRNLLTGCLVLGTELHLEPYEVCWLETTAADS